MATSIKRVCDLAKKSNILVGMVLKQIVANADQEEGSMSFGLDITAFKADRISLTDAMYAVVSALRLYILLRQQKLNDDVSVALYAGY